MGDGSLPVENYKYYLIQDYLFLVRQNRESESEEMLIAEQVQFARATALGAYKSSSLTDIGRSVQQVITLQEEIKLHIDFCKEQGLSVKDIESEGEDQATTAYTRYVLDIGQSQDWLALQVALLPCLIGYGIIAKRLFDDTNTLKEGDTGHGSSSTWTQNMWRLWQGLCADRGACWQAIRVATRRIGSDLHPCNKRRCIPFQFCVLFLR